MEDFILRALAKEAGVRGLISVNTDLVNRAARQHEATPTEAVTLAHGLTGVALMGALLKVQHRIAMKFEGNGPIAKMLLESDAYGRLRGYTTNAKIEVNDPQNGSEAMGSVGLLTVVKDLRLKELAESVVPIAGNTVAEELTYYLNQSEQIPSHVTIDVKQGADSTIRAAGGILIQALPPYEPETVTMLSERLQEMPPVGALLLAGKSPADILAELFTGLDYEVLEERPLRLECRCSWDRSAQALITLGRTEIESLIEEGEATVTCPFCHNSYFFGQEALEDLLLELD